MSAGLPVLAGTEEVSAVGLKFGKLTLAEWKENGRVLLRMRRALQWLVGDWFNAGSAFLELPSDVFVTSEQIEHGIARLLGSEHADRYVENCARVCRKVPAARRRPELDFAHHQEVSALPAAEQKRWLSKAVSENWSVAELRASIGGRSERSQPGGIFVPHRAVTDIVRWFNVECEEQPLGDWSVERRGALKRLLAPLVEISAKL